MMSNKKYILTRVWQSKTGLQETIYLGRYNDKIDYTDIKADALVMTKKESEEWLLVLPGGRKIWSMEEIDTEQPQENNDPNNLEETKDDTVHNE